MIITALIFPSNLIRKKRKSTLFLKIKTPKNRSHFSARSTFLQHKKSIDILLTKESVSDTVVMVSYPRDRLAESALLSFSNFDNVQD